jgi:hypothetical protein
MPRFFTECYLPLLLDDMDMGIPRYFIDVAMVLVVLLALRGQPITTKSPHTLITHT